jgi:outer membrane protein assembly factor BamA
MLPLILSGGTAKDRDGLGGAKTVRGMMRNRVVGEDYFYGNLELRWKFLQTIILKQNVYMALSTFADFGMTTRKYNLIDPESNVPGPEYRDLFLNTKETPHVCVGAGFHIALNENFIVAVDNGYVINKNDGDSGLYIGLKWLF